MGAREPILKQPDLGVHRLVKNLGDELGQCERDVQERMPWQLLLVHDDYGTGWARRIGLAQAMCATSNRCQARC